ncbi:MAG: hypothetical protein BWY81_00537 [Firmicutes bacterium ADurb.Bin467]|nr:MAG: hypothetical protein BWY81_00537 [Firmicutes bacterium ADurb.Bin467]
MLRSAHGVATPSAILEDRKLKPKMTAEPSEASIAFADGFAPISKPPGWIPVQCTTKPARV